MKFSTVLLIFISTLYINSACNQSKPEQQQEPKSEAQQVIDGAIAFHGLKPMDNASVDFKFREMTYSYEKENGMYTFTRTQTDTTGAEVVDMLKNDGLIRYIDGNEATITEERRAAYSRSVNSVIYFLLLPYNLNDDAVIKEYLGEVSIKGKMYHEVKITFEQERGGEDFSDVFVYWFDKEDYSMDYMAYLYYTDGGGLRFREAINPRRVNGVLIQDYINMKPEDEDIDLMTINELYEEGKLIELSQIIQEDVVIEMKK